MKGHTSILTELALLTLVLSLSVVVDAQDDATDEATCIAESVALNTNTAISGPYESLRTTIEADVTNDLMQFCNIFTRTCTINVADYSSSLESACQAQGGQIAKKAAYLDCTGKLMNIPVPGGIDVEIFNIPGCVGETCDVDNLPDAIEAVFDMAVEQVATEVETAVQQSEIECGTFTTTGGSGANGCSTLISVVSLATLFSWILL